MVKREPRYPPDWKREVEPEAKWPPDRKRDAGSPPSS